MGIPDWLHTKVYEIFRKLLTLQRGVNTGVGVHSREEVLFCDITKLSYIVYPHGVTMGKQCD